MSKLDKDSVLAKFTAAYEAANGKTPVIEAKGGWYSVDGGKNVRLAQLDEMADEFGSAPAAKAEKPKKAEKKVEKEAAAPKASAPKAKAAPKKAKAKKAASSFSVKDFYTQQINEANPGSRAPR
ncbi:hypothetical protein ISG33_04710 [Glaciecola sp. MH2013]|uniref:hypothetical protein n=1 Tax=Glaciecola sp. MH2013 TaxID=2785524 RepID=UPI00189CD5B2|nr:hypothetical protein [Glaciecola sp. MH2013]MBF7072699.1 hypothetical protein [Glaciecola sp. MH2013]